MKRFLSALAMGIATLSCTPALAADGPACSKSALLSLVETALTDQPAIPRIAARRYGAKAAFLKIRYADLKEAEAATLINGLLDAHVHDMDDLALAWSIHTLGNHEALAKLSKDRAGLLTASIGVSSIRALLLTENGIDILFDRIAATSKERLGTIAAAIVVAVIDQPDAFKEKIVLAAETRNIPGITPLIAALLVATESDPKAWDAFAARFADKDTLADLTRTASWSRALVGNPALTTGDQTPDAVQQRADSHMTATASALEPQLDFLNTYLNQTYDTAQTAAAAKILKTAIDDGKIRRNGTFDDAWLLAYRSLVQSVGDRDKVDRLLGDITIVTGRYAASGSLSIRDVIDRLVIVDALKPFVTGATATEPAPPAELSQKMLVEWGKWTAMAALVRSGETIPYDNPALFSIVAELLYAKGEYETLAAFVDGAPPGEINVFTATDFAVRLDRQCASYLAHPAEAVLLSGQPIFKFDTK